MSKKRKSQKPNNKRGKKSAAPLDATQARDLKKRKTLKTLRNTVIGVLLLGGAGAYMYRSVLASRLEQDLTELGNGTPMVVQIHDPGCSLCTALQKEVRQALKAVDDSALNYRVANIRTQEGRRFASRYGVPHVTLLLFDGRGNLKQTLRGPRQNEELEITFNVLIDINDS
ncbi:MAG: hypothetical protein ABJ081_12040 [Hyphomicrobiales bacterium]